ncbi:MAG: TonB-dependent receptor, partial [Ferruginibacter sp.]
MRSLQTLFYFLIFIYPASIITAQAPTLKSPSRRLTVPPGKLTGKVSDRVQDSPLPGATVYISDLKVGAITDAAGNYAFKTLPAGRYLVEVHYTGFRTVTRNVLINDTAHQNFDLEVNIMEENAVVLTGISKATHVKRSPIPIVSVSHAYLARNLSTNIIDAIAKVPGVSTLTSGPNVSKPVIRGLGFNRILTLYDGVRQEGQQWGDEHGIEVDQYGIEKIEIIKGPASLSYGSDALAGVVNLIPFQPVPEGTVSGELRTEYHFNNGQFGGSAMVSANKNGLEWMGRISHKSATNYRNKLDGRVYNTGFKETDANLSIGVHRKWGYSHLNFLLYDVLQEIPDGSRDSASRKFTQQITEEDTMRSIVSDADLKSYRISDIHQRIQHYRVYSASNFTVGSGRVGVNAGFQRSVRREFSHPVLKEIPGLFLQLNTFTYDVKYFFSETGGWNISAGINGMYQNNTVTRGSEFIIPSYTQFDFGPFALVKKTIGKLDVAGGARFDSRSFKNKELYTGINPGTGFDMAVSGIDTIGANNLFPEYHHLFSGFSGSIGATYNFSEKFALKANLSRGFRSPNIAEISANGVHPGTNIYQIGNREFKPEFSIQEDIGLSYSSKYAAITFSIFNNQLSNYIFNQKLINRNGADSIIVAGNQTYKFQQGKARLYGGEIGIDFHPVKSIHFENSLSVVYGKNKGIDPKLQSDSNRYLPFIPPLHGVSELRFDFNARRRNIVDGFIKVELAYYAKQDRVYLVDNTETSTPGYTLINAGLGTSFINKKGRVVASLYLMGNNLFNTAYQDHLSRLKYSEQ